MFAVLVAMALSGCARRAQPRPVLQVELRNSVPHLVGPGGPSRQEPLATPFTEVLTRAYGSNPNDGSIDLMNGMRLRAEHVTMRSVTDADGTVARRAVNDQADHDVVRRQGKIAVRLLAPRKERLGPAARLLEVVPSDARLLRLFYLALFNQAEGRPKRSALLVWADSQGEMDERTRQVRANPLLPCAGAKANCLGIPAQASVSVRVPVVVNGKIVFAVVGTTVRDLLREQRGSAELPASLTMRRQHRGRSLPVVWPPDSKEVLQLPLLAGDQMTW